MKIMGAYLIEQLRQVEDFRVKDGQRHQLWMVLLFVIMGTMSGYVGYRAWGDFVKRHRRVLIDKFRIEKHGVPSYSTIRRILIGVDFEKLAKIFNQWAQNYVHVDTSEWFGIDGKSIKGTVQDYKSEYQNFVNIVSVFTEKRGLVLSMSKLENKLCSEISTVQNLIALLDIEGVVFSLDALHCQKKLVS
ncbi:MAG: ISAs1 family transposase [Nostoc sp.]